jgi:tetratricopeptide (TPR) repeat protein
MASGVGRDSEIQALLHARNYAQALPLIQRKIDTPDQSADGHYLKGVMYYFQGQLASSTESLREALRLDPKHTDAAICLSVLLNDIGKYDEAGKVFQVANQSVAHRRPGAESAIDRKFAVKHLELADLYFRYRRYDEAIEEYSKAAILNPTALDIRIRRAKSLAKKGFVTRAIHELQQLKIENSSYLPVRLQLGLLHFSQGNVLDAEIEWESVLAISPQQKEATAYLEMARRSRV